MRDLIVSAPLALVALLLFVVFCLVVTAARRLVLRRCGEEAREELVEQAKGLLTGVSATFALFVGFAISLSWGAVTAAQNAVEHQSAAIGQMAWELRNIPDKAQSAVLMDKLTAYAVSASDDDAPLLARGQTADLPSVAALESFEDALNAYASGPAVKAPDILFESGSNLVSSAASVAAVANRALPRPLAVLLAAVAVLVTIVLGITTVTSGRSSVLFVYVWCVIPALSLTVIWALAFPFALRSGLTLAPLRAVADSLRP